MTCSIVTVMLKAPPNGLLRHTGECREQLSVHASPLQAVRLNPSQVTMKIALAAMTVWGLLGVGHLPLKPYTMNMQYAIVDFAKKKWIHYCTRLSGSDA